MPAPRPAGPYPLPGVKTTSWMVRFDKKGRCTSPATQQALLDAIAKTPGLDVIFFSHGWQTDFDGAIDTYKEFMVELEKLTGGDAVDPRKLLFVGVTWPSKWLPGTEGPTMAGALTAGEQEDTVSEVLQDLAEGLSDEEAAELYVLGGAASLNEEEARRLAELLIKATDTHAEAAELDDDTGPPDPDTVLAAWQAMGRSPAEEEDFDSPGVVGGGAAADVAAAGELKLDPLDAVRMFSLYQMKDRAGVVGAGGVGDLLRALVPKAGRVFAVGHSFGCKVMLSAVKSLPAGAVAPIRMLLMQPALSHLAFSANLLGKHGPAGYADIPARVQRIFTTYSSQDWPLHGIFHLALLRPDDLGDRDALRPAAGPVGNPPNRFAALGGYGPREVDFDTLNIGADDAGYTQAGRKIVALNGTGVISSHTDVRRPETARALRKLMG